MFSSVSSVREVNKAGDIPVPPATGAPALLDAVAAGSVVATAWLKNCTIQMDRNCDTIRHMEMEPEPSATRKYGKSPT